MLYNQFTVNLKTLFHRRDFKKYMGHRTKRILRIERKEYQTY